MNDTIANCIVIGDSVSIGYTGLVAKNLSRLCKVQHAPWDVEDGGAGSTARGVACLDNWLVTHSQQKVKWDVITFNFGLHDLTNSSALAPSPFPKAWPDCSSSALSSYSCAGLTISHASGHIVKIYTEPS